MENLHRDKGEPNRTEPSQQERERERERVCLFLFLLLFPRFGCCFIHQLLELSSFLLSFDAHNKRARNQPLAPLSTPTECDLAPLVASVLLFSSYKSQSLFERLFVDTKAAPDEKSEGRQRKRKKRHRQRRDLDVVVNCRLEWNCQLKQGFGWRSNKSWLKLAKAQRELSILLQLTRAGFSFAHFVDTDNGSKSQQEPACRSLDKLLVTREKAAFFFPSLSFSSLYLLLSGS